MLLTGGSVLTNYLWVQAMQGLDPQSGEELWSVAGAGVTTLVVVESVIYMGCYDKSVRAIEAVSSQAICRCL